MPVKLLTMKKHFSGIFYSGMFEPVRDNKAEYKLGKLVYKTVICRTNECPADKHNFHRQNNKIQCPTDKFLYKLLPENIQASREEAQLLPRGAVWPH
jgi:hypothetical protein